MPSTPPAPISPARLAARSKRGVVGAAACRRVAERRAGGEREQERRAAGRQRAHRDVEMPAAATSASSARPVSIGAELGFAGIHRPDRHDRMARAHDLQRRMQRQRGAPTSASGSSAAKPSRIERRGVGGVIGAGARRLEPRDIGEIGQVRGRRERGDEIAEIVAVGACRIGERGGCAATKTRAIAAKNSSPTMRSVAGKLRAQRVDEADDHVVAVDREALLRRARGVRGHARPGTGRSGSSSARAKSVCRAANMSGRLRGCACAARRGWRRRRALRRRAPASPARRCPIRSGSAAVRCARSRSRRAPRPDRRPASHARRSAAARRCRRSARHGRRDEFPSRARAGKPRDRRRGSVPWLRRRHEHVVDVEQQAAAGAARDLGEEFGFRDRAVGEVHIGRRIFQQHLAAQRVLHLIDMRDDARRAFPRV